MRIAKALLVELTKQVPPCDGCRHNITVNDKGDIEVALMMSDGKYQPIILDKEDLDLSLQDLLQEILQVLPI